MKYDLKKIKSYELKLSVTLDKTDLDYYVSESEKRLANDLRLKGFRKGKAPPEIAKNKLNKKEVLETAFDFALRQSFADVLIKEKIELISTENLQVKENSLEKLVYSISLITFPEFKLADYHNIPVEKKEVSVSDQEVDQTLEFLRKSRTNDNGSPELNDDFAKNLGQFNSLRELKNSVSDGLKQEKETRESKRIQSTVLDKVAGNTKIEVPPLLIERQLDQMMLDLDADLHRQGLELGLFLAKINKSQDQLRGQWKAKAEILVKKALVLKEIAKIENIKVESEEVKEKINGLLQNFTGLEQVEKNTDLPKLTDQIHQILLNEKVLAFLEKGAGSD